MGLLWRLPGSGRWAQESTSVCARRSFFVDSFAEEKHLYDIAESVPDDCWVPIKPNLPMGRLVTDFGLIRRSAVVCLYTSKPGDFEGIAD